MDFSRDSSENFVHLATSRGSYYVVVGIVKFHDVDMAIELSDAKKIVMEQFGRDCTEIFSQSGRRVRYRERGSQVLSRNVHPL